MKYNRGWFGERHRHYLAAKGIKTRYDHNRYFVRNDLKGNRGDRDLHSLYAQGHSKPDAARGYVVDPKTGERIQLPASVVNEARSQLSASQRQKLIDVPEGIGGDAPSTSPSTIPTFGESVSFSPIAEEPVPVVEQELPAVVQTPINEGIVQFQAPDFSSLPSSEALSTTSDDNVIESEQQKSNVVTPGVPESPGFDLVGAR